MKMTELVNLEADKDNSDNESFAKDNESFDDQYDISYMERVMEEEVDEEAMRKYLERIYQIDWWK